MRKSEKEIFNWVREILEVVKDETENEMADTKEEGKDVEPDRKTRGGS